MKILLITIILAIAFQNSLAGLAKFPGLNEIESLVDNIKKENPSGSINLNRHKSSEPRNDYPVPVMIQSYGYPCETHKVITEDCYILEMHRIPYGRNDQPPAEGEKRPAVYLQHGLLSSSADYVMGIPEKFLGYILADEGYDVWLGNYRGNTYGRDHCSLDPDKNEFWNFSWDQNGKSDIPAMIDTILAKTGHEQIHYVGHSMGTTGFMVLMHEKPEYAHKVIMANFMAPVAYMEHMESTVKYLTPYADSIEWIAYHLGLGEFFPSNWLMDFLADLVCDNTWTDDICSNVLFLLCGYDPYQTNHTLLETLVHHTPAGASTYQLLHYAQEYQSAGFHHYDLRRRNEDHYGTSYPPPYIPYNMDVPISLYWSHNDWFAAVVDVDRLREELPNIFDDYEVPFPLWNHLDYMYGIDADKLVYPQLISNIAKAQATLAKNK